MDDILPKTFLYKPFLQSIILKSDANGIGVFHIRPFDRNPFRHADGNGEWVVDGLSYDILIDIWEHAENIMEQIRDDFKSLHTRGQ